MPAVVEGGVERIVAVAVALGEGDPAGGKSPLDHPMLLKQLVLRIRICNEEEQEPFYCVFELYFHPSKGSGERNTLAHILDSCNKTNQPLKPHSKPCVRAAAVYPQIPIPPIFTFIHASCL